MTHRDLAGVLEHFPLALLLARKKKGAWLPRHLFRLQKLIEREHKHVNRRSPSAWALRRVRRHHPHGMGITTK